VIHKQHKDLHCPYYGGRGIRRNSIEGEDCNKLLIDFLPGPAVKRPDRDSWVTKATTMLPEFVCYVEGSSRKSPYPIAGTSGHRQPFPPRDRLGLWTEAAQINARIAILLDYLAVKKGPEGAYTTLQVQSRLRFSAKTRSGQLQAARSRR